MRVRINHFTKTKRPSPKESCDEDMPTPVLPITDDRAKTIEAMWKKDIPGALLTGIPSKGNGVGTLTHEVSIRNARADMRLHINGLPSNSILANNAFFTFEVSRGKYINLYEIMLPDIPGTNGEPSTIQYYTKLLSTHGILAVAGDHFHWFGQSMLGVTSVFAIHHQSTGNMSPEKFSEATIDALLKTLDLIEKRLPTK